jgi:hypothetical protein
MNMMRVWPVVLQYGVGAVLCAIGVWCGLRSGYLDLQYREDRRALWIIIGGFIGMLLLSCVFTFWLPFVPRGGAG